MEQRQVRVKLQPMGPYSKILVLPRWWLKLNGDPNDVDINLSLSAITIQPAREEEEQRQEESNGKE